MFNGGKLLSDRQCIILLQILPATAKNVENLEIMLEVSVEPLDELIIGTVYL